jgi:hypothetical protein
MAAGQGHMGTNLANALIPDYMTAPIRGAGHPKTHICANLITWQNQEFRIYC